MDKTIGPFATLRLLKAALLAASSLSGLSLGAGTAQAQEACVTVTTVFPILFPARMSVGEGVQVFVNARNGTRTFPRQVFVPGQVGGDVCDAGTCRTSGKVCVVDADCTIDLRVQLACRTSMCAEPLPGTLVYLDPGGNGCVTSVPGVAGCAPESKDPNSPLFNNVIVTLAGGAANAIPIIANGEVQLARIQTTATSPVRTNSSGFFQTRVGSVTDFFYTDDLACVDPVSGGGGDSASAQFSPAATSRSTSRSPVTAARPSSTRTFVSMNEAEREVAGLKAAQ